MPLPLQTAQDAPWKARYRAPRILYTLPARSAPGRAVAATNRSGVYQLYAWDSSSDDLRQLTHVPTGKLFGSISPDGRYVYYLQDEGGNEIGHYVRVPFEGGEPEDITPSLPPYSSLSFEMSRDGSVLGFMTATRDGFQCYAIPIGQGGKAGQARLLYHGARFTMGPVFSCGGELAVLRATEHSEMQHFNLVALDVQTGERVAELWDGEGTSLDVVAFSPLPGDFRVLATTNRTGLQRPLLWNPRTGERTDLQVGDLPGDVLPMDWSDDGSRILLSAFDRAVQRLYIYEVESGKVRALDHPSGTFGVGGLGCYFAPGNEIFAQWEDSQHVSCVIVLDADTGEMKRTVLAAGEVPSGHKWKPVSFPSSGGQEIQGWLGLPDGDGPFPVILHTHGGPESVATELFVPSSQSWIDHGFAFLTVNYRGSTTFGREFQEAIWGHPGRWEVDDMAAGRDWLVKQGIGLPDQVFVTGGSYGGYLTLLAVGKEPGLWAGGMAVVAIADWTLMYEDQAETLRGYQRAIFGGSPEEKPEEYAAASPITCAEQVRAPLLVIQGRNDTRCPDRQMEKYEAKLRSLGKDIEVVWFEAGHGSMIVEQQIEQQEMMLRFAYRVLGLDS